MTFYYLYREHWENVIKELNREVGEKVADDGKFWRRRKVGGRVVKRYWRIITNLLWIYSKKY